ncbi:hypothetical protein FIBSPDRAFT_792653 [Athelia psychrophila]|uniref:Nucleoside phosphatase GDA1/CD39 n=1 Tax=Athelia psychrophila TaxID=1759441 RepID=A0A166GI97_9AGAM|nr:hypothetical protein FIBSPDRAFT_792653 [Fibularhizoctonia sp. CBS 109695]
MPPPTAGDAWLTSRQFGIVIDAGSSGSRLQIYSWKDPRSTLAEGDSRLLHTLPKVEKGVQIGEEWVSKVEPGLSTFADDPEGVGEYLAPLINHARAHIPPSAHANTPIFLLATAGMRLLTPHQQAHVLQSSCDYLRLLSTFRIDDPSPAGPCGSSVRIITGEEEGLFGWIAVNYLMDGFTGQETPGIDRTTYGFLDMGGASTQIAFEPNPKDRDKSQNLVDVRLRLLGGQEIHHEVFVTTWLGYGTNQARERYVGQAITEYEKTESESPGDREIVYDPCLPKDLELIEVPVHSGSSDSHSRKAHTLRGTGSFEECLQKTAPLLNKNAPCPDAPCLFNGVHVPPIDFSASHFIGVSEYWYSSDHVFGLGGPYDYVQYERAASEFCARDWDGIVKEHKESGNRLSGDGEVMKGGHVVEVGKWGDKVELSRLEMQCFKAAWVANVLHDGLGMPRIVDPGGNGTTHGDEVAKQASTKGLGRPTFQSVDTVGDIAISWTLGKMILEASKGVPLQSKSDRPLGDPLDDIQESPSNPIKPIRPPFLDAIEDHMSHHLPVALTRHSLGFSPVLLVIYVCLICATLAVLFRMRRHLRPLLRRLLRRGRGLDREATLQSYSMEEGKGNGYISSSSPASPSTLLSPNLLRPIRRLMSSRPSRPHINTAGNARPGLRHMHTSPAHGSPRSSSPTPLHSNIPSRSSSPSNSFIDDGTMSHSLGSLSRSRNSSQMNLTSAVPRQISRANSALGILGDSFA